MNNEFRFSLNDYGVIFYEHQVLISSDADVFFLRVSESEISYVKVTLDL